ncbi:cell division protein FtsZ [Halomicroarcula sp. F13]|uniref:Cell division protein FtsZ n=2 Tax=Haloarcula rubra TaxID=2487747 RepID=A0AAW4PU91_9EURY|nr:cell division protein FtsZ [Halomicroarcula rubra]
MGQIATPLIFNSTIRDLQKLKNVDRDNWYGVAEGAGLVPGTTDGFEEQVTGGFGRNPVRANEVMEDNRSVLQNTIRDELTESIKSEDDEDDSPTQTAETNVPFAFVFCGLGGGTGCGITPHLIEAVDDYTNGTCKTIAVCVLPNTQGPVGQSDEEESASPSRQAWNARYGIDRIEDVADGIILVDNERLSYHEAAEGQFTDLNEYVASSIVDLVSGTVLERIDRSEYDVDPPIIDIQDIVTSLSFGLGGEQSETGYASMGRSVQMTKSLSGYLLPFIGGKSVDASALSHLAELKQTVEGADTQDARKAIGLLRAPSNYVADTDYQIDTSKLRSFLTARCDEVNLGATLTKRNLVSFTTLFTYRREDLDRLDELESLATEYERESEAVVS